ncbi:AbrB/MazE/SpoVT family DNA-binding domain-containing protein [Roseateles toxinivorans]|uniref:SpoVT-AbrB domain-containing protein n=1 Tax=Roseateles toxinivorans TaxID=270368 RepID=A0A4R6QP90_9BURK|nr:AbrB/MazE/SpoVT family DNA-binding domain-containing protein [Roseateles toxinivorans]TDP72493.1 hypothetical protein DES47_102238 [Roseateles toxinivorans]
MLAKITAKNQLTLPKSVTQTMGPVEYFDVEARGGQIILTPVRIQRGDAVRAKLAELDLSEKDLQNAAVAARGAKAAAKTAGKTRQQNAAVKLAPSAEALPPARRTLPKRGSAAVTAKPLAKASAKAPIKTRQSPSAAKKAATAKRTSAR